MCIRLLPELLPRKVKRTRNPLFNYCRLGKVTGSGESTASISSPYVAAWFQSCTCLDSPRAVCGLSGAVLENRVTFVLVPSWFMVLHSVAVCAPLCCGRSVPMVSRSNFFRMKGKPFACVRSPSHKQELERCTKNRNTLTFFSQTGISFLLDAGSVVWMGLHHA